jgi:pimeloyl-ACP methyl ester carboxylesterase
MTRRFRTRLPGALLGLSILLPGLAGAPAAEAAPPAKTIELGACEQPNLPPDARCGTYEVWENRAAKSGRKIPLNVVVIPALGKPEEKLPDAFTYFAGGPGDSSVNGAGWMAQSMKALRQRRDILLVDFRGTGGSAGLFCEELQGNAGIQGFLEDFMPAEAVKRCAERLAKTHDLAQYTSANTIDDVDEVRAALGYEQLNLMGGSAGTRLALVYLRRHPERVRTAVLLGSVPTDELGPFSMARSAQDALDGVIAECQRDEACRAAFPELKKEVAEVFRRVEREPVVVRLTDAATGEPVEVRLSKTGLAQTLRYMLYVSSSAFQLPLYVHLAAQGDWKPLAETARFFGGNLTSLADGYYLALTCAEDLPYLPEKEVPAAVAGTFLGDFRIRKQQAACNAWPATPVGREFLEPVVSDVPVLLISGGLDPVTPPSNAEHVARTLKNSRHLVVEQGGHSFNGYQGIECIDQVIVDFVQAGTLEGLDTSCLAGMKRPEFALKLEPEIALKTADLEPLTGTYKDPEIGFVVKIELAGDRLRATPGSEPPVFLVPLSPTRFRLEGMPPGMALVFQRAEGGKATAIVLEQPGAEARTLVREEP